MAALPADYLIAELEHLLEVVDQQPEIEKAAFMVDYITHLIIPEAELVEALAE